VQCCVVTVEYSAKEPVLREQCPILQDSGSESRWVRPMVFRGWSQSFEIFAVLFVLLIG